MEFFELNAKYIYTAANALSNTYFIHVITNTDQANYQAGNQPIITHQSDGTIDVELQVVKNLSIPEISVETPVVHTVNIGTFQPTDYHEVNITVVLMATDGSSSTIGGAVLSTAAAVEDSKPIEIDDD